MIEDLVSVITASYNSEKYIIQTIQSVIDQSYSNWEMIIVDDSSKDNTCQMVEDIIKTEKRIKLITLEKNSGPAIARNRGIQEANGQYICFLDSDDLWKKNKLEQQIKYMKQYAYPVSFSQYEEIDAEGNSLNILIKTPKDKIDYKKYLLTTPIGCLTAMYDTKILGKVYFPSLRNREDTGLWLKILKMTPYAYPIPLSLAFYRIHSNSITANKIKLLKYQWELYFNIENLGYVRSIFYICSISVVKLLKLKEKRLSY